MPRQPGPQAPERRKGSVLSVLLLLALTISIVMNVFLLLGKGFGLGELADLGGSSSIQEQFHSGKSSARDKIAIIKMDGVIMEGSNSFVQKEIDQAAADSHVKAVVLRINSPGGTITGSDDLHRRILELKQGKNPQQKGGAKTVIVSMGAVAASGGYYIAMPADYIVAETTTITGSIGVYAAFPNISGLAKEWGIGMNVIKAGAIKDSGSMFKEMTPEEQLVWQVMVDGAYERFTKVVEDGRVENGKSRLKVKLQDELVRDIPIKNNRGQPVLDEDGKQKTTKYVRQLADGGIWMAQEAKEYGLIDDIGYLQAAIDKAKEKAGLSDSYKVITYERPPSLTSMLLGAQTPQPNGQLDAAKLAAGATPRLWYLAPQSELAGILAAMGN
jgi:protease-4